MSITCPHCQHVIKLKAVKAGRYTPGCPACKKQFVLTVSGDEGAYQFSTKGMAEPAPAAIPVARAVPANLGPPAAELDRTSGWIEGVGEVPPSPAAPGLERTEMFSAVGGSDGERTAVEPGGSRPDATRPGAEGPADFYVATEAGEPSGAKAKVPAAVPGVLGGYEIVKPLGQGGMGTVYLARQVSLDRPVALKVMNPEWAQDPTFLARFTREAYAAAQLVHHNIVQIYDIGEDHGIHFFSMEYVTGQTLAELLKKQGKLDPEEAVGYVLQAARGLKFAHDQGMVHRDIKPDNLMLNDQGIVKVADLGLVKTPGADEADQDLIARETAAAANPGSKGSLTSMPSVTRVGSAMGTPAFMAPEQGRNAARVDHRADIYSLGCTLYVLLTGRPPFKGTTAMEVMVKHLTEPLVPPDQVVKHVPRAVSDILLRMMAKKPEERYADLGAVIRDFEQFLGVQQAGPFTPTEEHVDTLEACVKKFNEAPAARLRARAVSGFLAGCAALTLLAAFFSLRLAGGVIGLATLTALITFVIGGIVNRTYLFLKVRQLVLGSTLADRATWGAGLLLFVALLYVTGLLAFWLGFLVLAAALAATYYFLVVRPLAAQRRAPLEKAERLLKSLRLKGLPEESVRQFICKYSGPRWEEFFETLFGYEALAHARKHWARDEEGRPRHAYAAWRDPLVQWIDARQKAQKEARERQHLARLEEKKLQAQGVEAAKAKEQGAEAAAAMVVQAAELKQQAARWAAVVGQTAATVPQPEAPVVSARSLVEAAEEPRSLTPEEKKKLLPAKPGAGALLDVLFGPQVRFLAGAALLALCFLWMSQNGLVPSEDVEFGAYVRAAAEAPPLKLLPAPIDRFLSGFNVGLAGLLLVFSSVAGGRKFLFFLVPALLLALAGPHAGVPAVAGVAPVYVSMLGAFFLAEFGFVFDRASRPRPV